MTSELEPHILKRFEIKKRLGKGAYGIVWKAMNRKTREVVALKKIFDAFRNQTDAQPSNVLLDSDCFVKLCDFGLARSLTGRSTSSSSSGVGYKPQVPALTEYVATRWYRAPEILLACHDYTKGVDMWSLGCILGEMLSGSPLFPGTSTLDQLERIMATLPKPNREDLASVKSPYSSSILEKSNIKHRRPLEQFMPKADKTALDLMFRMLHFNPHKRITAMEALKHPYVRRFYCPEEVITLSQHVVPPLDDNVQLSVSDYRNRLYQMIASKKLLLRMRKKEPRNGTTHPSENAANSHATLGQNGATQSAGVEKMNNEIRTTKVSSASPVITRVLVSAEVLSKDVTMRNGTHAPAVTQSSMDKYSSNLADDNVPTSMNGTTILASTSLPPRQRSTVRKPTDLQTCNSSNDVAKPAKSAELGFRLNGHNNTHIPTKSVATASELCHLNGHMVKHKSSTYAPERVQSTWTSLRSTSAGLTTSELISTHTYEPPHTSTPMTTSTTGVVSVATSTGHHSVNDGKSISTKSADHTTSSKRVINDHTIRISPYRSSYNHLHQPPVTPECGTFAVSRDSTEQHIHMPRRQPITQSSRNLDQYHQQYALQRERKVMEGRNGGSVTSQAWYDCNTENSLEHSRRMEATKPVSSMMEDLIHSRQTNWKPGGPESSHCPSPMLNDPVTRSECTYYAPSKMGMTHQGTVGSGKYRITSSAGRNGLVEKTSDTEITSGEDTVVDGEQRLRSGMMKNLSRGSAGNSTLRGQAKTKTSGKFSDLDQSQGDGRSTGTRRMLDPLICGAKSCEKIDHLGTAIGSDSFYTTTNPVNKPLGSDDLDVSNRVDISNHQATRLSHYTSQTTPFRRYGSSLETNHHGSLGRSEMNRGQNESTNRRYSYTSAYSTDNPTIPTFNVLSRGQTPSPIEHTHSTPITTQSPGYSSASSSHGPTNPPNAVTSPPAPTQTPLIRLHGHGTLGQFLHDYQTRARMVSRSVTPGSTAPKRPTRIAMEDNKSFAPSNGLSSRFKSENVLTSLTETNVHPQSEPLNGYDVIRHTSQGVKKNGFVPSGGKMMMFTPGAGDGGRRENGHTTEENSRQQRRWSTEVDLGKTPEFTYLKSTAKNNSLRSTSNAARRTLSRNDHQNITTTSTSPSLYSSIADDQLFRRPTDHFLHEPKRKPLHHTVNSQRPRSIVRLNEMAQRQSPQPFSVNRPQLVTYSQPPNRLATKQAGSYTRLRSITSQLVDRPRSRMNL